MNVIQKLSPAQRSVIGILLFVPLAAIILMTLACLPAPIGEPEKATLDKDLIGAWEPVAKPEADAKTVVLVRGLDAHTYLIQYLSSEKKNDKEKQFQLNYRGWLTTLGGETFLCLEALDDEEFLGAKEKSVYYWAAKITKDKDKVTALPLAEGGPLKDLKTRAEIEEAVAKNIKNKEMYGEEMTYRKMGQEDLEAVRAMRKRFSIGMGGN